MTKSVKFRVDEMSEMLEVYIDGKLWQTGNFWDFDFLGMSQELLHRVGVQVEVEEYEYDDGFEDKEWDEE